MLRFKEEDEELKKKIGLMKFQIKELKELRNMPRQ
jgi:hypothetical protein